MHIMPDFAATNYLFLFLFWKGLGHCISMKSNHRETIISLWKLLKHLMILSVLWEEMCILSLCASILPLLSPILILETTHHKSSLFKRDVPVEVRGEFSCTQWNVFPPPRLFWLYSSKPQDTQWMCKHLHFINQSGKATFNAGFTQSASSY